MSCQDSHVGARLGTPAALLDLRTVSLSVEQPMAANERQASRMVHFGGSTGRRSRFGASSLQDVADASAVEVGYRGLAATGGRDLPGGVGMPGYSRVRVSYQTGADASSQFKLGSWKDLQPLHRLALRHPLWTRELRALGTSTLSRRVS